MSQNFISCDRDQVLLLPLDLSDWLPEGHLARFVIETVEELDLSGIYGYYRADGRGRPAHDPAMMVALVLYSYAVGVTSSRAIERRCVEDVAFRVITANRQPDHATIARFLVRHREAISKLFFEVLALCQGAGMVKVGTVAVDSTKLAANASLGQNRTYEGLREEARRIVEEAIATDEREDQLYGSKRGDELPEELADPRTRKARIKELLDQARVEVEDMQARREAIVARHDEHFARTGKRKPGRPAVRTMAVEEQREIEGKRYNLTDPDSGIVRHRGMLLQGYNVQTTVCESQVILSARATGVASDGGQLEPTVLQAEQTLARLGIENEIEQVLADGGYWDGHQIAHLRKRGLRVLVPPPKRKRGKQASSEGFEMQTAFAETATQQTYRRRQQIVEPVFAHIKHIRGITQVLRRRKDAVQAEIDLIATTHNLLKLYRVAPHTI